MALIGTVCPHCRDRIVVDDLRKTVYCMSCGREIVVEEIIESFGTYALMKERPESPAETIDDSAITITGCNNNATPTLFVNGKAYCPVKKQETVVLDLEPGTYTMWARAGMEGSSKQEIELKEGDRLRITYSFLKGYNIVKE